MTYDPLREANPVPYEDSLPSGLWDSSVLLDVIDERNGWMDTKQLARAPEPEVKKRGWPIALLAAAAVVLMVVATVMLTGSGHGGLAPATDNTPVTVTTLQSTPPTEASAPTTEASQTSTTVVDDTVLSAQDQALVEGFVAAFNSYDEADLLSFFSPEASIENNLSLETDLAGFGLELPWRWAMNEQWEIVKCQQLSAISCTFTITNDALSFRFGAVTAGVRIVAVDGAIVDLVMTESMAVIDPTLQPFYDWLDANYPDKLDQMRARGGTPGSPRLDQQSVELWLELLSVYKAEAGF